MKNKIVFLDFDSTLIDSPLPDTGKEIWKQKTGTDYPHEGWWGKGDSLNLDVFEIKPIVDVLKRIEDLHESVLTVLLTNRVNKVENEVNAVLRHNGIQLDYITFKVGRDNKGQRIAKFLDTFTEVTEVEFYDDTEDHFTDAEFLKEQYPHVDFKFFLVKDGKVVDYNK